MKAVILAAGRGSRMGAGTQDRPKCLTELAGKPLLEWQLESLRAAGVSEVLVVRGYRAESLKGDFHVVDNPRWAETNMAASLACAADWLATGPTLISYSDIVYHPDHVSALAGCCDDIAITADSRWLELWRMRNDDPLDDAETFREEGGRLKEIGGKPATIEEVSAQYMGLLLFSPQGWECLYRIYRGLPTAEQDRLDMTGWIRRALKQGVEVAVRLVEGRWVEVDLETDREKYQARIGQVDQGGGPWSHDWRWR